MTDAEKQVPPSSFPVVGVGASAGGLEALDRFFASVPPDPGMAFVVVTHTSPGRTTLLPELLAAQTTMPVHHVERATPVERDHVYVAPAGHVLDIRDNTLLVGAPAPERPPLPIDHFFRSLAADRGPHAFGVVLSGTGTDGTLGIREIKGAGGLAVAQEESSAMYTGMPHSAAATALVDYILPPSKIPDQLVAYARAAFGEAQLDEGAGRDEMARIFTLLRRQTGHDFSAYKPSTLRRRIERRMNVAQVATPADYVAHLERHPEEIEALFRELLIGVTSFFRDPDAFDALAMALDAMVAAKPQDQTLRIWVPGCSTGEEAYSIGIVVCEVLERRQALHRVQIFATDLDPNAIEVARQGLYPESIAGSISPARLQRYFTAGPDGYRIRKDVREMIVFAPHNATSDPPFTRLDLLSCRNVLIYLNADLQSRLLPLFHYALNPGGILFLGPSESLGSSTSLFDTVDKKWKLFLRRATPTTGLEAGFAAARPPELRRATRVSGPGRGVRLTTEVERLLLEQLVPPNVLVRATGEIVHIHGRTGQFLELQPGALTSLNVLEMARGGLRLDLAGALRDAAHTGNDAVCLDVPVPSNAGTLHVDIRVRPVSEPEPFRGLLLVVFESVRKANELVQPVGSMAASERLEELQRELQHVKGSHQAVIEELEAANEELKSTNEELQSSNEELQSSNEELETSKEEMQSLNEELQTVNAEMRENLDALSRSNDDMRNLLNSTDIATVFLDDELRIKRFTDQARSVLPLIPTDVGRPIGDLVSRLDYASFVDDARAVLHTLAFREKEVRGEDGRWYLTRILPYRTTGNVIEGLVITFVDVTRIKGLQERAGVLDIVLRRTPTAAFGQDADLRYEWLYGLLFGVAAERALTRTDAELFPPVLATSLDALKQRAVTGTSPVRETITLPVEGGPRQFAVYVEANRNAAGVLQGLTGVMTELPR
ncbi:MAG: PAS domain-containing protein [Kofleriaceae bacterium]|nr:MAG: PAS domain-containing protein [Kofleriaceae bacterium]MBZ0235310.1 PAS domain-containing protein [Kofleriaceae bacterium]